MPDAGLRGLDSIEDYRSQADSFVTVLSRSGLMSCGSWHHAKQAQRAVNRSNFR